MFEGLNFILLSVPDLNEAETFYTEKLGFEVAGKAPGFLQFKPTGEGAVLALEEASGRTPYQGVELWWQVSDADGVYSQLSNRGVTVVSPPKDEPFGRAVSIQDPGGNKLNMYQPPAGR